MAINKTVQDRLAKADQINIGGNNYDRSQCVIEISGGTITDTDISTFVKGIEYTETADIQFGYAIGSRRPTEVGYGKIEGEGTLTVSDAGLNVLNKIATDAGLPSLLYFGQGTIGSEIDITVSYITYDGVEQVDQLQGVYFKTYNNSVNNSDVIYERDIEMIIGRVSIGAGN